MRNKISLIAINLDTAYNKTDYLRSKLDLLALEMCVGHVLHGLFVSRPATCPC